MDLVYGEKSSLPAVVLIERAARKQYRISFLPTAEYINPDITVLNGLLEHYTLRIMPGIEGPEDFKVVEKNVLEHISEPFIVYF